jgi:hypothetical protein
MCWKIDKVNKMKLFKKIRVTLSPALDPQQGQMGGWGGGGVFWCDSLPRPRKQSPELLVF